VVVTYRLDRLSRSLSDFVKLIDLFDKHDVTFVSNWLSTTVRCRGRASPLEPRHRD
jgi:hypothetical protein